MPRTKKNADLRHAAISSAAVALRTGKGWNAWFNLLDRAGARRLEHPAIARLLNERHGVDGWWAQMITVAWEQARGWRVRHQRIGGSFEVSASRTIAASRAAVWKALVDPRVRRRWVNVASWDVRTRKAPERVRIDWPGDQIVEFSLVPKAAEKCQVVATHSKLHDARSAATTKRCWARALERMKAHLEKP